jgi:hypothetical protein
MSDGTPLRDSPTSTSDRQITLQVGERRFITTRKTLVDESCFFASLLSGRWDNAQEDGSYFIDSDANLFEHILRYLRRGVLPVFYDRLKGHDYALYGALLEEARFFRIDTLEKWLREQKYLQVIQVEYLVTKTKDKPKAHRTTVDGSVEIEHHLVRKMGTKWYCSSHACDDCNEEDCARSCGVEKRNGENRYEDTVQWAVIRKRTTFNHKLCIQGR